MSTPRTVAILMGSDSDLPKLEGCFKTLDNFGIPYVARVLSAHRTPDEAAAFARTAEENGFGVIIAAAGMAAHLAGVVAGHTVLPVIGIPVPGPTLAGLDSLLSMVQMPSGVPVATVAVGGGGPTNAALLAVQILALSDPGLTEKLHAHKREMKTNVTAKNEALQQKLQGGFS